MFQVLRGANARATKAKELWPTVMRVSEEACLTYFDRVHRDFNKKVAVDYSAKLKAGEV